MKRFAICSMLALFAAGASVAEEKKPGPPTSAAQVADRQLSALEREFVPLADAMPEEKLDYKPAGAAFKDSRTFRQQVGHAAGAMHLFAAALLGEDTKPLAADEANGPANLKTRAELVAYLKDGFAHAHRAIHSITDQNMLEQVSMGPNFKPSRLAMANLLTWHGYDHYGQLVVYLRLNDIVPPASR